MDLKKQYKSMLIGIVLIIGLQSVEQFTEMFIIQILVQFFAMYVVIIRTARSDFLKVKNNNNKTDLNLNLSAAVDFIIKSVNATDVRIVGCSSFFQNGFHEISERWRILVSLEIVNVERKYTVQRKIPKNVFILIFVDQNFTSFLQSLMESSGVQIRKHKIVVIFKSNNCDNNGYRRLEELSSVLWTNKILNFIILRNCNMTGDVHSYFPFANDKCREFSKSNIIRMGTFYFNTSGTISFKSELPFHTNELAAYPSNCLPFFPNKIPLKLNNCKIIVSTGIWPPSVIDINSNEPGIEMDFILTLGQHLNATLSFVVDSNSFHGLVQREHEEHTGRLAQLKKEEFDLMLGAMPAHVNIFRDFDTSECYLPNSLTFIVPKAGIFPSSMILWTMLVKHMKLFLLIVGIVIFLAFIISLMTEMTWKMYPHSKPKKDFLQNICDTVLAFLRSLIEPSTPILPQNRTIQWIYAMWFATCLIISCYFNTTLTSFFTEPGRLKELQTVQEIIDSNIQISLNELYYPVMTIDPNQEKYFISKNTKTSILMGLKRAAMGTAATFVDRLRSEHIAIQWVSSSGERSIHFITDGSLKYWNNIVFHRGNVFTDRINNLVKRINQSGYWESQKRKYYNRRLIRIMIRQYLMVYNYHQGICNDRLINLLNKDFNDTRDCDSAMDATEKFELETNEQDIIQRFVRTDKTSVTWETLSTVFRLWAIGMAVAGIVFVCERLLHYIKIH